MPSPQPQPTNLLALDVGEKRIGVARVSMLARLPEPLPALSNDNSTRASLLALLDEYDIDHLIVGLPRNMQGEETAQSAIVRTFCANIVADIGIPYSYRDETLTSVVATERLGEDLRDGRVDSEAARLLLEDYVESNT